MTVEEARKLIEPGVDREARVWADLGAGSGTFTLALNEILGFDGIIFAVDQQLNILRNTIKSLYIRSTIHLYEQNFTLPMDFLPGLDGIVLANSLHYVKDQTAFLNRVITTHLKPGGILVVLEYDRYEADQWVPYPLPLAHFNRMASQLGMSLPEEIGRKRSIYGNQEIYSAYCHRGT